MQSFNIQELDKAAKSLAWKKIIEAYNNSGQKQTDYCKKHGVKQDLFYYYLRRWRKANANNTKPGLTTGLFMPIELAMPQGKCIVNIGNGLSLELPDHLSIEQVSALILNLRRIQC